MAWVAISLSRAATGTATGLNAEYISGDAATGEPVARQIDADISTARVPSVWRGFPPERFTIRWSGFLAVGHAGAYTFATTSDDGSVVTIDGHDGRRQRRTARRSDRNRPDRFGGGTALRPDRILTTRWRVRDGLVVGAKRRHTRASPGVAAVAAPCHIRARSPGSHARHRSCGPGGVCAGHRLVAGRAALRPAPRTRCHRISPGRRRNRRASVESVRAAADLALFAVLAIGQTWPLASDPGHLSRNDNGDTVLNEWVLAWVAHQAPHDPLHLYDANNFYPERDTLAYAEAMIPQSALAAPLLWLGASPVLAYNIVLIAGFALSGWAMCLVVTRWTGDWAAGWCRESCSRSTRTRSRACPICRRNTSSSSRLRCSRSTAFSRGRQRGRRCVSRSGSRCRR